MRFTTFLTAVSLMGSSFAAPGLGRSTLGVQTRGYGDATCANLCAGPCSVPWPNLECLLCAPLCNDLAEDGGEVDPAVLEAKVANLKPKVEALHIEA
ncbi:hypothetical protein QBC37DRAFT_147766 [Rhypophila decipiens]|uniref:Uncharacterized protein n=1 Tax=Rhypophila decipiens TaxID=261697 RepID=A0AAN6XT20_9PEZI|nr:hypothetical protein QBC37DRAFT_147766 [Rhypophila decipiens]